MRKKILFFAMTLLLLTGITASADVLGEQNGGWSTYMGAFTYFHNVQFNSDSVGKQNEYYVEYTPNEDAVPIVVNGASIWGTRNIKQADSMMKKETDRSLNDYKAYSSRYHIAHILYVDQDKELTKIDISDDSVRKMPVSEF